MRRQLGRLLPFALALCLLITPGPAAENAQDAWAALARGRHVALIRHGSAPPGYGGDPPGFRIDDCATQRNWMSWGASKPGRSARPSVATAYAWTASCPRRGAAAWTRLA
jgi:hypothetical protein